jgi:hypothetical protein
MHSTLLACPFSRRRVFMPSTGSGSSRSAAWCTENGWNCSFFLIVYFIFWEKQTWNVVELVTLLLQLEAELLGLFGQQLDGVNASAITTIKNN